MTTHRIHPAWPAVIALLIIFAVVVAWQMSIPEQREQPADAGQAAAAASTTGDTGETGGQPYVAGPPCGDWPMWRYNANRSNATSGELPAELHLQWVRTYPALEPAWEDPVNQDRMPYDRVYEPVVVGSVMVFGSNRNDRVTALDTRSGRELWRFYTDGPVRMPPAASDGKVFVTSDDGHLYCLEIATGRLLWKHRAGPDGRKILGNSRLVSMWPARGGPTVADGVVYYAGSIWPFMGIFLYALDATSGDVIWTNDTAGQVYMGQPHGGADAFGGIAPQGAIAVAGDSLIVPGGRSVPACFDRGNGEMRYFHLGGSSYHQYAGGPDRKLEGGSHVSAIGDVYFNHRGLQTTMYDRATGEAYMMWRRTIYPVLTSDSLYLSGEQITAYDLDSLRKVEYHRQERDSRSRVVRDTRRHRWEMDERWSFEVDAGGSLIKAGRALVAGGKGVVSLVDVAGLRPRVKWSTSIEGTAARLIAADNRLFVVTLEGRIYAFGAEQVEPTRYPAEPPAVPAPAAEPSALVAAMIDSAPLAEGYCLAFGVGDGSLIESLARESRFRIIAVDPNAERVAALRRRLDDAGLYGPRVTVHVGEAETFGAPPYLASLIVSQIEEPPTNDFLRSVYHSLRPYGGTAWLPIEGHRQPEAVSPRVASLHLAKAEMKVSSDGGHLLLSRQGRLPGAAEWNHMYGDIANTSKSDDDRVRAPLGLLWFGGNTHHDILPRHAHGPPEQVVGGRLIIQGDNCLSARDVYTGKRLWKREFDNLGTEGIYYDESYNPDPLDTTYNQVHIPGANARGTNFVAIDDEIYLITGGACQVLDIASGETRRTISLPADPSTGQQPSWGYLGIHGDYIIAGSSFVTFSDIEPANSPWQNFDSSSSRHIVVLDRMSGKVLWQRSSAHAFRHNAIVVGDGRLFAIDSLPHPIRLKLIMRGRTPDERSQLLCFDLATGKTLWQTQKDVFGTWLGYSRSRHILLQSGRASRDMIAGEPSERMIAYDGRTGNVIWDHDIAHSGPCMIHHDTVYLNAMYNEGGAISLLTGEPLPRRHPLTGQAMSWHYHRTYGCNSVVASEHLLAFRSGAAGFYDLGTDCGTGNLGGFKSGCTSNLIAADGVLNAPDYTRTCTCSYQNQTSVALVNMPDVEVWTCESFAMPADTSDEEGRPQTNRIHRMGLNFGAPGDRISPEGTLWLEWPIVGGPSPAIAVTAEPVDDGKSGGGAAIFGGRRVARHSSRMADGRLKWVAASALVGVRSLSVNVGLPPKIDPPAGSATDVAKLPPTGLNDEAIYTVRLVFAELENRSPGDRVFDVAVQGKFVLNDIDVARKAGGPFREIVHEIRNVVIGENLEIIFTPKAGEPLVCGLELIQEDVEQNVEPILSTMRR